MKKKSIKQKVFKYLQTHKAITPLQALRLFGSMRLGAEIHRLRQEGVDIITTIHKKKRYAIYSLGESK